MEIKIKKERTLFDWAYIGGEHWDFRFCGLRNFVQKNLGFSVLVIIAVSVSIPPSVFGFRQK